MAAVCAKGETVIRNAACEPHVQDLCNMLNCVGAQISGVGQQHASPSRAWTRWANGEFTISPDYLEVGSFLGLGAVTRGEIRIHGVQRRTYADDQLDVQGAARRQPADGRRHA